MAHNVRELSGTFMIIWCLEWEASDTMTPSHSRVCPEHRQPRSKIFLSRGDNPLPEDRTSQLSLYTTKRTHDRLEPHLEDLPKERPDSFLCLRAGRIVRY